MLNRWFGKNPSAPSDARVRAYDALMGRARRALDEEPDLALSSWARIRADVTGHPEGRPWYLWGAIAAMTFAAVALVISTAAPPSAAPEVTANAEGERGEHSPPVPLLAEGSVLSAESAPRTLRFGPGHVVTLEAHTRARLEVSTSRLTRLRLMSGRLKADVVPLGAGEGFEVVTVEASVKVVGTRFTVSRDPASGTDVVVQEGRVELHGRDGIQVLDHGARGSVAPVRAETPVAAAPPGAFETQGANAGETPAARPTRAVERPHAPEIIDIRVPDAAMTPRTRVGSRATLLRATLQTLRTEGCSRARSGLLEIMERHGPAADVWYLLGYCAHRMGHTDMSDAYFERYRRADPAGTMAIPASPDMPILLPSDEALLRL